MIIEIPLVTNDPGMLWSWFWGLSFFIFIIATAFVGKFGFLASATFGYLSINALWCALYPNSRYATEPFIYIPIAYLSSVFAICLLAAFTFAYFFNHNSLTGAIVNDLIGLFALGNALYVIYGRITGLGLLPEGVGYSGWLNYSGMNGSLIAVCCPFLNLNKSNWLAFILCFIAIVLSRSSIPYGVMAVMAAAWLVKGTTKKWVWSFAAIPVLLGGAFDFRGFGGLLNSGLRFDAYKTFMGAWWNYATSHMAGTGMGSFHVIGKYIQQGSGFMKGWQWPNMHSDWLQMLFEGGYVGVFLVGLVCLDITRRLYSRTDPKYLCTFLGLIACALFDFPFRYFEFAFVGIITGMEAYRVTNV